MREETVVLIKPDGVKRGLVGKILARFEAAGLKIMAAKMVWVDKNHISKHYRDEENYLKNVGEKTLETYARYGQDPQENLGTNDPVAIGKMVRQWNIKFLSSGPIFAVLLSGAHAVETVRKIVGSTLPFAADPGSIRGAYSVDSPVLANQKKRAVRNLIHASGDAAEAEFERKLWFRQEEIFDYKRADEEVMFE